MAGQAGAPTYVFVGTYTTALPHVQGKAEGIYVYQMDPATGALIHRHTVPGVANPSYLELDPRHRYLYAVNEVSEIDGQRGGGVSAFAVDQASGALTFLNRQLTRGEDPCHLCVDAAGRYVLVANYSGGSVAVFPVREHGELAPASDFVQHVGSSVNPQRQQGPHAHSINLDPTNRFAVVADLGLDQLLVYRFDRGQGKLIPNDPPSTSTTPGAGPRHLAFHPSGRYAFVVNEIASTLSSFAYDAERGILREVQTLSTLPADFAERNSCADVHVHPNGRFVYGSNRGHDSIAIFAIDEATGGISPVGHASTAGRTPRNFAIDPTGTFLLAANQNSSSVVTYRIDGATGRLTPAGPIAEVPTPVCLKIVPMG